MDKYRKRTIVYVSIAVLVGGLWIVGAVLEYLIDSRQTAEIQELRSRIEKIEASRKE